MRKKLGECLIQAGLITEDDLQAALTEHKRTGERLGAVLVRLNLATERQIAKALAYQLGFPYLNLAENPPDSTVVTLIQREVALKRSCVAIRLDKNLLTVAMADPLLFSLVQDLEFQTGYRIKQVVATRADILESIAAGYPDKALMKTTGRPGSVPATRSANATSALPAKADAPPGRETASRSPASRNAAKPRRSSTSSISS
jgi:type IV pilus assembly protein PilB